MKIIKKLFLVALSAGLLSVPTLHEVNANTTDDSKEKWSAIGTINGSNWDKDFALLYDSTDDRYELEIALTANQEFKIRLNNAWTTSIGYGGNTGAGINTYLTKSGDNFKVKTTGNYVLWVKDDNVRNYGDKSYGFGIDKAAELKYVTVTHYTKDGTQLKTEQVIEKSTYEPAFAEVEGYKLEGWYTDKELTKKFEKGTSVTTNISLYPKYVEATDYTIYFEDSNSTLESTVYAYMYCDAFDGHYNAAWPGTKITKNTNGKYEIKIDASKTFDTIIFNAGNDKPQTANLDLSRLIDGDSYKLNSTKDSSGNYNADIVRTSVSALFNSYYNDGSYTKDSILYTNEMSDAETKKYFHASADIKYRRTVYSSNGLTMTTSTDGDTYSGESTYTNDNGKVKHTGIGGTYTVNKASVEDWFVTLYDFKNASAEGWSYDNGVYSYDLKAATATTEDEMTRMAREFVAPMWLAPNSENFAYAPFNKLTVSVENDKLVMRLFTSTTDAGKLSSTDGLFSQVTIYN